MNPMGFRIPCEGDRRGVDPPHSPPVALLPLLLLLLLLLLLIWLLLPSVGNEHAVLLTVAKKALVLLFATVVL